MVEGSGPSLSVDAKPVVDHIKSQSSYLLLQTDEMKISTDFYTTTHKTINDI